MAYPQSTPYPYAALTDSVGSGNPYYGSGFVSLDRYLQKPNIDWGAEQSAYLQAGDLWSESPDFGNWMIDVSGRAGFPKPSTGGGGGGQPGGPIYPAPGPKDEGPPEVRDWSELDAHVDRAHENNPWYDEETGNYYGLEGRDRWRESDIGAGAGYRDW